jgi:hypothetical protein
MLPSPSLGPPLLSASPSPPLFCGIPPLLLGEDSAPPGLEVPPAGWDGSSEDGFGVEAFGVEAFGAGLEVPPPEPEFMCSSELSFGADAGVCSPEELPDVECDAGTLATGALAGVVWVVTCAACFLWACAAGVVAVGVVAAAAAAFGVVAGGVAELDLLEPPHPAAIADAASSAVASAGARSRRHGRGRVAAAGRALLVSRLLATSLWNIIFPFRALGAESVRAD